MALLYSQGCILCSKCSSLVAPPPPNKYCLHDFLPSHINLLSEVLGAFLSCLFTFSSYQVLLPATKASFNHHHQDFHSSISTAPCWTSLLWDTLSNKFPNPRAWDRLPTTPDLPFCRMEMARQRATESWCLLFKTNLKYLTLKLFTQGLRSVGLWSFSRGSVKKETILG